MIASMTRAFVSDSRLSLLMPLATRTPLSMRLTHAQLNDEPHEKGRGDENHQPAHRFRRPPVTFSPSRLPLPPTGVRLRGRRRSQPDRSSACLLNALGQTLARSVPPPHHDDGGRTATPARTAQLDSEFRFPARPAINTAEIQTVARTALSDTSCMSEEYPALNGAVPECYFCTGASGRKAPSPLRMARRPGKGEQR